MRNEVNHVCHRQIKHKNDDHIYVDENKPNRVVDKVDRIIYSPLDTMTDTTTDKLEQERVVLDTIKRLIAKRGGISPTIVEIRDAAEMSYGTTYLTVERLEDKTKITRIPGVA